jgi:hypothetical protein
MPNLLTSTIEAFEKRTITRNENGYTGTREFHGPFGSIVSDISINNNIHLGASWPTDFALSGWNTTSLVVTSITIDQKGRNAYAVVGYSTRGGTDISYQGVGDAYIDEAVDVSLVTEQIQGTVEKEGEDNPIYPRKDANGALYKYDCSILRPQLIYTRTQWYSNAPYMERLYKMVGRVNHSDFKGAGASTFLMTGAQAKQIETSKWEVVMTFQYQSDAWAEHWNAMNPSTFTATGAPSTFYRDYQSTNMPSWITLISTAP